MRCLQALATASIVGLLSVCGWLAPSFGQEVKFVRGDANDDRDVDISDAVYSLRHLFAGSPSELSCEDAADANDDGGLDISDPIYELSHLFLGGPPPLPPFSAPGCDTTADGLSCLAWGESERCEVKAEYLPGILSAATEARKRLESR